MGLRISCDALLEIARKEKPHVRYTRNKAGTAIAGFREGAWNTCAGLGIDGNWYSVGDLLINGEPVNKPEDWLPDGGKGEVDGSGV